MKYFELVLGGHPDKFCDIVAETVAEYLRKDDPKIHTSVEVAWFNDLIIVGGETNAKYDQIEMYDIRMLVKTLLNKYGFSKENGYSTDIDIEIKIRSQSQDIQDIVKTAGTGDNGVFFGGWHPIYSPTIIKLKTLVKNLTPETLREFNYASDGKLIAEVDALGEVRKITLNIAHPKGKVPNSKQLNDFIKNELPTQIAINPKGEWDTYGGVADSGLTGRKLACDSQCGLFHHGGGALFGKDLSKADRSIYLFLTLLARDTAKDKAKEYVAHTIIGNEYVKVRELGTNEETKYSFNEIKLLTSRIKLDFTGNITTLINTKKAKKYK